ncbi:MAG: ZIP family metal transporter [Candidatus Aenigmarchaeota archaeon]|nr:ZIP family metal transporter [Candidatus Aenigmarchaeota archaeon]
MNWMIIALSFATFISTMIGGSLTIRFRKLLPYFFAFSSGSLIAVTFFDILPESLIIANSIGLPARYLFAVTVGAFLFYTILEKYFLTHHHHDDKDHPHIMGPVGAGGLIIHSFLDGVAIGAAFLVNPSIGLIIALAVIFHDFTDGSNTVTLMLKNKHHVKNAAMLLFLDALAPVVGVLSTNFISINESLLAMVLAFFAGEFIYIGASNLLPETHKHPPWNMILSMSLAIVLIFVLTSVLQ